MTQPTKPIDNSPRQGGCCFGKGKPAPAITETVVTVANPVLKEQPIVASPAGHWNTPGKFTVGAPTEYKAMPGKEEGSK